VLLDEIEKAHPDVFNVLLQVLEDGRLTDGKGRTVDCRNAIWIMTSNLASEHIRSHIGETNAVLQDLVEREMRQVFRPEFLNRVDETIIFSALTREDLLQIVDLQVEQLNRLLEERRLSVQVTPAARTRLAEIGYDPAFGARPLRRAIQRRIQDPLALELLEGRIEPGDVVVADVAEGEIVLARAPAGSPAVSRP
jgi:ATP-dependent Clp protease ATP-binding subunit ClpA